LIERGEALAYAWRQLGGGGEAVLSSIPFVSSVFWKRLFIGGFNTTEGEL
jgi:hypothetical protein